jgi:hypothetical protein
MQIEVEMRAFWDGKTSIVDVPDAEWTALPDNRAKLEQIFYYGQNDFQPKAAPSVSVGDVVRLNGKLFRCENVGWAEIPA